MRMDHDEAQRVQASSQYLIGDLSAEQAAAFEEHYFSCAECAAEVTVDEVFAANLRDVFESQAHLHLAGSNGLTPRLAWMQRASFVVPLAAAACLLLAALIYQNVLLIPAMRTQMAVLYNPPAPVSIPLKLAREENRFSIPKNNPFWVAYFRLPKPDAAAAYQCDIETADGIKVKTVAPVSARVGQPFYLLLPSSLFPDGMYRFKVRGLNSPSVIAEFTADIIHE